MSADEYEAFLAGRNIPRGTLDTLAEAVASYAGAGVSRFYVQEYAALDDVDTDRLEPVFNALRG